MRIGLLGAGRIGAVHAQTLADHPSVDSFVVFDADEDRAIDFASSFGADTAPSADAVMRGCDGVVIASSTDTHAGLLIEASSLRLPVLCEKPIAPDLESTDRAIAAVEGSDTPVMIGFNRRFDPGFRRAHAAVAEGSLGRLMLVVGQHHDYRPPPEDYLPVSGGQFKDQLIHDFDLLRFVTGQEVVSVHAAGTSVGFEVVEKYDDTSVSVVTLWLESGAIATLSGARLDPVGYDVRMEVFGTSDSIAVGLNERTPIASVEDGQHRPQDPYQEWLGRFGSSYRLEIDAFLEMVRGNVSSPCTVHDARKALVIAEACRESLDKGVAVDIQRNI